MSFDLRVKPDGEYPDEYSLEDGWPNDEYHLTPFFSAKFVRDSDIIEQSIVDQLYSELSPEEAVEVGDQIETAVKENPQADHNHRSRLRDFADWLYYWGKTENCVVQGGP